MKTSALLPHCTSVAAESPDKNIFWHRIFTLPNSQYVTKTSDLFIFSVDINYNYNS